MVYRRVAGQIFRYLWLIFAFLVILYALLVIAGRELLPVLNRYLPPINAYLSEKTGMDFKIESMNGMWQGATPLLEFNNLIVVNQDGDTSALTVSRFTAELNLLDSLKNRSPVWRELVADQIHFTLIEDGQGRWNLGDYPLGLGKGDHDLDSLFRMLYYSRLLRIDRLVVDFHFFSGAEATLFARDLVVENQAGFHRTKAAIALSSTGDEAASLILEGRGDPADAEKFTGNGYLHLNRLNLEGSLKTLVSAWFPQLTEKIGSVGTGVDLSFWFDWKNNAIVNGRGQLKVTELPLLLLPGKPVLSDVDAGITAWFQPGQDWGFNIQQMEANWNGSPIQPFDFKFRQRVGSRWGELDVALNHIDLEGLRNGLVNANVLGDSGEEVLQTLQPKGQLRRLFLDVNFGQNTPELKIRANLDNLSLASWKGSPAARGLSGYIEAGLHEGFMVIDSPRDFALLYPQAYSDFMSYGETIGKVVWQWIPERQQVLVTSNRLDIRGEEGHARVFLHLNLPTGTEGKPEMDLMVGMRDSNTRYVERYLPNVLNEGLTSWLNNALEKGDIPEAGFIWRGSLRGDDSAGRSVQVYARLRDGQVDYQQGWPAVENLSAMLAVDNSDMDVWVESGVLAGEKIKNLGVNLRQNRYGPLLRVVGHVDTDVDNGFDVLASSPLQNQLSGVTSLQASGPVSVDLDLRIPLSDNKTMEDYRVDIDLRGTDLQLPLSGFAIDGIKGLLQYNHSTGLTARALTGSFWGKPLNAVIGTKEDKINIHATAGIGATGFHNLLGPFDNLVKGETPVEAELVIPLQPELPLAFTLESTLEGVTIKLPEPFAKVSDETLDTRLALEIGRDTVGVRGAVADKIGFAGLFEQGQLSRGTVRLLSAAAELPARDELMIQGELKTLDWSEWQPLFQQSGADTSGLPGNVRLNLSFDDLIINQISLGSAHLSGGLDDNHGWVLGIESDFAGGQVTVPKGDLPPGLHLDYLKIPKIATTSSEQPADTAGSGETKDNLLATLSPQQIPELDFSVKQLFYGEELWGEIAFKSRKLAEGVEFNDIEGNIRGIEIKPRLLSKEKNEVEPAQFRWTNADNRNASFFSGTLEVENIKSVLSKWGMPAPYDSKTSNFYLMLGWEDKPWQIDTLALDGYMGVDLRDGQFYEATGAATNAFFKLVGLINFDTWLRRLRFDFSDFFSGGLSFDQVKGGLLLRKGLVDFEEPIVASTPGGQIRLLGTADLIYEELNARLVVTMPVSTNLPWVVGLLGGLPAAAGVFVTSKIFEKQVDQLSTISYRVTGPFHDPKIEVEKIFTDPTKVSNGGGGGKQKK